MSLLKQAPFGRTPTYYVPVSDNPRCSKYPVPFPNKAVPLPLPVCSMFTLPMPQINDVNVTNRKAKLLSLNRPLPGVSL